MGRFVEVLVGIAVRHTLKTLGRKPEDQPPENDVERKTP